MRKDSYITTLGDVEQDEILEFRSQLNGMNKAHKETNYNYKNQPHGYKITSFNFQFLSYTVNHDLNAGLTDKLFMQVYPHSSGTHMGKPPRTIQFKNSEEDVINQKEEKPIKISDKTYFGINIEDINEMIRASGCNDIINLDNGYSLVKTSSIQDSEFLNSILNKGESKRYRHKLVTKCEHTESKHYAKVYYI
jgi:hypothetical protein